MIPTLINIVYSFLAFHIVKNKMYDCDTSQDAPHYYGYAAAISSFFLTAISCFFIPQANIYIATYAPLIILPAIYTFSSPTLRPQYYLHKLLYLLLYTSVVILAVVNLYIIVIISVQLVKFFSVVPILDFMTGTRWHPDSENPEDSFGVIPLLLGTGLVTITALSFAIPLGILAVIYITEYAPKSIRVILKSKLEVLTGIPTIVYGYIAVNTVNPLIRNLGQAADVYISTECALGAGVVMGIMIIPLITSLSYEVISSVPKSLRYASLALGATKAETFFKIILPVIFPGLLSSILLAFSRAIGETIIVLMAVGVTAQMTFNPLSSVTTITVQIVKLLLGDHSFESLESLSAYALGGLLFIITWFINAIAILVVRKYKKQL